MLQAKLGAAEREPARGDLQTQRGTNRDFGDHLKVRRTPAPAICLLLSISLLHGREQKATASKGFLQNQCMFACGQNLTPQTGNMRHFNICPRFSESSYRPQTSSSFFSDRRPEWCPECRPEQMCFHMP